MNTYITVLFCKSAPNRKHRAIWLDVFCLAGAGVPREVWFRILLFLRQMVIKNADEKSLDFSRLFRMSFCSDQRKINT